MSEPIDGVPVARLHTERLRVGRLAKQSRLSVGYNNQSEPWLLASSQFVGLERHLLSTARYARQMAANIDHWNTVWGSKQFDEVSWFEADSTT